MKVGDLVKFKSTRATAMIIEIIEDTKPSGAYVQLYVADGTLDFTPAASGFTHMSLQMLERTAEVINESR